MLPQHASVAQSVEQWTENPRVVGSIPTGGTMVPILRNQDAGVAHPVERHLAKVEVASSSLVTRSKKVRNVTTRSLFHMVPWPSGKARVCKTLIRQFKSGRYLQTKNDLFRQVVFCLEKSRTDRFEPLNAIVRWTIARWVGPQRFLENLTASQILYQIWPVPAPMTDI